MDNYWASVATIIAALIAAVAAWFASVLAKENRISEFRQAWIDAVREDIAEFLSLALFMGSAVELGDAGVEADIEKARQRNERRGGGPKELEADVAALKHALADKHAVDLKSEYLKINQLRTRIEMRLNPDSHAELLKVLERLDPYDNDSLKAATQRVTEQAQMVFGREWGRVKSGEPVYIATVRWAKASAAIAGVLAVLLALSQALGAGVHQPDAPIEAGRSSPDPTPARSLP